jgi:hypothetical protein
MKLPKKFLPICRWLVLLLCGAIAHPIQAAPAAPGPDSTTKPKNMVYLVLRSEYQAPYGRKILEFPDSPDLVSWLRTHWITRQDLIAINPEIAKEPEFDASDWQDEIRTLRKAIMGDTPNGLSEFFVRMVDHPLPENLDDVRKFIDSFEGDYGEGRIELNGTAIQAHTDDDEIDLAWYL